MTELALLDYERWKILWKKLGLVEPADTFQCLQRSYAERHRKYHNAGHIHDCLRLLDESRHPQAGEPLIEFALWFHDAIYDPFSSRNEQRSARWAAEILIKSGAGHASVELVESLILATCHTASPATPAQQLLVDIDLSILGAPPQRYREFERQIRSEYWWVPAGIYRRKRLAILESFTDRPAIYKTDEFGQRFEARARANLKRSIGELKR